MTSNGIANTPSRFHSAGRQGKMGEDGCVGGGVGGIVPCVSNKTVINIIMYVDRALDFLWLCCGYWTRRPSNLEAICKGLERSTQRFIMNDSRQHANMTHASTLTILSRVLENPFTVV